MSLFLSKRRYDKFDSWESEGGIVPTRLLSDKLMYVMFCNLVPRNSGIGPEMFVLVILKNVRFVSLAIVSGIGPERLRILVMSKCWRYVRSPIAGERWPVSSIDDEA